MKGIPNETDIQRRLRAVFWDLPRDQREQKVKLILQNPSDAFKDQQTVIKLLGSFSWYELINLMGAVQVYQCLTDQTIKGIFPPHFRNYYQDARRLLSKYSLPVSG